MKNEHAVALGREGGRARAAKLSKRRRVEIAQKASDAAKRAAAKRRRNAAAKGER